MEEAGSYSVETRPFNPLQALIGVVIRPVAAMQAIATARPWPIALALSVAFAILGGITNLTAPPDPLGMQPAVPPDEIAPNTTAIQAFFASPVFLFGAALISPLVQLIVTGVYYLIARLFGGHGRFSALYSTIIFAGVPGLISVPLALVTNLVVGPNIASFLLQVLASFAISIWALVLQTIAVRESMALSTGRAIGAVATLIVLGVFLACTIGILLVAIIALTAQSTAP